MENIKTLVNTRQKEAHRLMVPIIGEAMAEGHARCVQESGRGCYNRAKEHLQTHVESVRGTMFQAATGKVVASLNATFDEIRSDIDQTANSTVSLIARDYRALLADGDAFKALSAARDQIRDLVADVDDRSRHALRTPSPPQENGPLDQMTAVNINGESPASLGQETPGSQPEPETPFAATNAESSSAIAIKDEEVPDAGVEI
ncbi:hypothetical protein VTK26DRAFT_9288 [Humicola hyalothermophila]